MADGSVRTMRDARLNDAGFDLTRSWALPFAPFPVAADDEPLSAYLTRIGFTPEQLQYTRRSWGNAAGDAIERISARAAVEEMTDTSAGQGDFRILDGYDSLLNRLADGIDIRLNTVVTTIEWERQPVRVHTANGEVFEADQVVITLPLGVLKSGQICFVPELPADKQEAIGALTMGYGIKLVYRFDAPLLPEGVMAFYSPRNPPMWWSPSFGHDSDAVVITAFATGDWARELLSSGEPLERALATLRVELGRPNIEPLAARLVNWVDDPYSLGGYSVAPPGAADARACLAQPTAGRLFWAGEATAPNPQASTVHGAYASGRRAAAAISLLKAR